MTPFFIFWAGAAAAGLGLGLVSDRALDWAERYALDRHYHDTNFYSNARRGLWSWAVSTWAADYVERLDTWAYDALHDAHAGADPAATPTPWPGWSGVVYVAVTAYSQWRQNR